MDSDTIEELVQEYDRAYAGKLQSIEQRLNEALPEQGHITKAQLEDVLTWKFDGMAGRGSSNIERMREVPDAFVRSVSEAALLVDDPKLQLETLNAIPGVGYATATVILAFYDPTEYAIGDRYIMHALLDEDAWFSPDCHWLPHPVGVIYAASIQSPLNTTTSYENVYRTSDMNSLEPAWLSNRTPVSVCILVTGV